MSKKPRRIPIPDGNHSAELNMGRSEFLLRVILIIIWTVMVFLAGQGSTGKFCKDGWYKNMITGKLVKACVYTEEPLEMGESTTPP